VRWRFEMKTMSDIQQIVALYNQCGSHQQVARDLQISRNTVKKYLRLVDEVSCGIRKEIIPKDRDIVQPRRSITDEMISFIHTQMEENMTRPEIQRRNARQIHDIAIQNGYSLSYSSVKKIITDWKRTR
jgi:hypothetical protein